MSFSGNHGQGKGTKQGLFLRNEVIEKIKLQQNSPSGWRDFTSYFKLKLLPFSLPVRGGVGEKFFQSTANTSMLKRMKKQLTEAADYHHKCVTELDKRERCEISGFCFCFFLFGLASESGATFWRAMLASWSLWWSLLSLFRGPQSILHCCAHPPPPSHNCIAWARAAQPQR